MKISKVIQHHSFSLRIYNHLSPAYIQYIKIEKLLKNTYYCQESEGTWKLLSAVQLFLIIVQKFE